MSTTTTPITQNVPVPAIAAASTPGDVIRAMTDNPELRGAVLSAFQGLLSGDKSMLQSKTFWAAIVTPIVATLMAHYAAGLDNGTVGAIDTVLETVAMIAMRLVTKTPVTGIISAKSAT